MYVCIYFYTSIGLAPTSISWGPDLDSARVLVAGGVWRTRPRLTLNSGLSNAAKETSRFARHFFWLGSCLWLPVSRTYILGIFLFSYCMAFYLTL